MLKIIFLIVPLLAQISAWHIAEHISRLQVSMYAYNAKVQATAFNFDEAITDITHAIDVATDANLSDATLAALYKQRGDHIFLIYEWDRVLADYNRAIELDPAYADAYFARGVLYYTQGPRPNAAEDFARFVELAHPADARVAEATEYIDSIAAELEALGGSDTGPFGPTE